MIPFIVGIIAVILFAVIRSVNSGPSSDGVELSKRFAAIGPMVGKTKTEILERAQTAPTGISSLPGGKQLLQWQMRGYHIAIRFTADDIFDGITHQHIAK